MMTYASAGRASSPPPPSLRPALSPATWPRRRRLDERLLWVNPSGAAIHDGRLQDLPTILRPGDLLVVNDAATIPASLRATLEGAEARADIELRLLSRTGPTQWQVVVFGAGDWRTLTESRPAPPPLAVGARLLLGERWRATVVAVSPSSPRLVEVAFDGDDDAFWTHVYRLGRPVQYAYVDASLDVGHVQTVYASRPWAVEMPSAGRPLTWGLLLGLVRAGVGVTAITHAAGLSSTGDVALDAQLPVPERYDIGEAAARAIVEAKQGGGRIVAVGTTVVRALEGSAAAHGGQLLAGSGTTDWLLGPTTCPRVVDGLLTGMHEPATSHFRLLEAFAPRAVLERAYGHATTAGYLGHEFGDAMLVLGERRR